MGSTYILRKGVSGLSDLTDGALAMGLIAGAVQQNYFVDSVGGNDNNDGLAWATAKATIMAALNLARRLPGTSTIDDTKDHHTAVWVAPGHYNEAIAFSGYNIHLIGLSCPVPGKDYGVSVNYDGATAATAALAFSGSGIHIANLHVYCDAAIPAVFCAGGDNNLLENLVIECDGTNCTYGIQTYSMKGSWIRNCVIQSAKTAGIFCDGGADRYCINGGIEYNQIYSAVSGAKGIYIEDTMTAYNFRVHNNWVELEGAGATAKGIDNDAAGNVFITENYVVVEGSASAVESASHGQLANHSSVNGTVTDPDDDD